MCVGTTFGTNEGKILVEDGKIKRTIFSACELNLVSLFLSNIKISFLIAKYNPHFSLKITPHSFHYPIGKGPLERVLLIVSFNVMIANDVGH